METLSCSRCETDKAESEWHPSVWRGGKSRRWCKACMKAYYRARNTAKLSPGASDDPRSCVVCGSSYQPKIRNRSKYCSPKCHQIGSDAIKRARRFADRPERTCPHCAATIPATDRLDKKFCSVRCNEAAHALQRKLRARTGIDEKVGYVRAYICERDQWRCGICCKAVDPSLQHPDPLFGSLDHIIPVSEGGTNDTANLRLAHLVCNLSRRDRGGHEQLALFG